MDDRSCRWWAPYERQLHNCASSWKELKVVQRVYIGSRYKDAVSPNWSLEAGERWPGLVFPYTCSSIIHLMWLLERHPIPIHFYLFWWNNVMHALIVMHALNFDESVQTQTHVELLKGALYECMIQAIHTTRESLIKHRTDRYITYCHSLLSWSLYSRTASSS